MLAVVFKSPMMICVVQTAKTGGGWISAMLVEMVNSTRLEDAVRQRSPQRTVPICDVGPHLRVGVGHEGLHQHRDHCLLPNQLELLQRRRVDVPELCDALQRQAKINASSQDQCSVKPRSIQASSQDQSKRVPDTGCACSVTAVIMRESLLRSSCKRGAQKGCGVYMHGPMAD